MQFRRNEVNSRVSTRNAMTAMNGGTAMPDFFADEDRAQRNTLALRDVAYGVVACFAMTAKAGREDNVRKFEEMFERRMARGCQHFQPYLGCREFPAIVEPWDGAGTLTEESRDLGWMLHDIDFGVRQGKEIGNRARFFPAALHRGVVEVPTWQKYALGEPSA